MVILVRVHLLMLIDSFREKENEGRQTRYGDQRVITHYQLLTVIKLGVIEECTCCGSTWFSVYIHHIRRFIGIAKGLTIIFHQFELKTCPLQFTIKRYPTLLSLPEFNWAMHDVARTSLWNEDIVDRFGSVKNYGYNVVFSLDIHLQENKIQKKLHMPAIQSEDTLRILK
ncbi:uncharacterized protein EV154DRAFT_574113 [Mucor mucedo]|uniref:uncharacterized protein n=1 Tax=Mucor mucedo TaxID=29922 RepID=UPI0022211D2F|nr:uncharacterized protein EV154DRAFT_574113 [Mucor mucedo]KAI7886233.1 hypothetical protein EV154DRAFT_574113 [Mucor mucedo]